jgi:hypothetical protein
MSGEVLDFGGVERCVEPVLDVLDGLTNISIARRPLRPLTVTIAHADPTREDPIHLGREPSFLMGEIEPFVTDEPVVAPWILRYLGGRTVWSS